MLLTDSTMSTTRGTNSRIEGKSMVRAITPSLYVGERDEVDDVLRLEYAENVSQAVSTLQAGQPVVMSAEPGWRDRVADVLRCIGKSEPEVRSMLMHPSIF